MSQYTFQLNITPGIVLEWIILRCYNFPKLTSHPSSLVTVLLQAITFQIQTWGLKIFITTI